MVGRCYNTLRKILPVRDACHWNIKRQSRSSTKYTLPAARRMASNLKYNDDIFNFTRGRFVCDKAFKMSQRHVHFNVEELARLAAESVRAKSCASIEKYPDGMYNKAMLLTMDDGAQVVARVPNPNAGKPHFTIASEVASMDFARNFIGTPVPRVLAWNSRAYENPVGAEYIIMEKVPGIELESIWSSLNVADKWAIVQTIAGYQKAWMSISFKGFGSLYFAEDLGKEVTNKAVYTNANGVDVTDSRFAIGPSTGREIFDDGRGTVDFDRGPWETEEEYHTAIGYRETACVKQLSHLPKSPITLCGPGTYQPTRERKLEALQCYLKLIPFLLPEDQSIASSHLWHGDLHLANIFVNPSKPTEVVGIIDWQSTELSPLYYQARQPHFIDYIGPPLFGLERPREPTDEEMQDKKLEALYFQQVLCSLYNTLIHHEKQRIHAAFKFQQTPSYLLLLLARNLVIDGEIQYLLQAAELEAAWHTLPQAQKSAYPLLFSEKQRQELKAELDGVLRGMGIMTAIRDSIGELFPEKGLVALDRYDESLNALEQMKEQIIEDYAKNEQEAEIWRKEWPFGS